MNFYSIRHLTRFRYSRPISESIMETRMHPRSDSNQHCLTFSLSVSPRCRVFSYRDHLGNNVQHFDIPGEHNQLVIVAESVVEQQALPDVPALSLARCLGRARRPDRVRRLLGDAAALHLCRRDSGAHAAGQADGRHPPRRSADAGAGAEPAALRLLRLRAALHARRLAHRRGHRQRQGRLPGLCPHHDRPAAPCAGFRRAMSPAISTAAAKTTTARRPTPRTPGSMCCCRIWAGWASTRPTTWSPTIATSAPPWAATTPMCRRRTASFAATPTASSMSPCTSRPAHEPPALDRKLPIPEDWSVLVERAQQPPERSDSLHRLAADAAAAATIGARD